MKPEEMSDLDKEDAMLTKEQHLTNYVKILDEIQRSIEPFREHAADVKRSYRENNWLSKEEMSRALKAYRMLKSGDDLDKIYEYVDLLKKNTNV